MERELPPEWRDHLVHMIRGAVPASGVWFTGGPVCTPEQQIGIYVEQYRLRLLAALREESLGVRYLLGDATDDVLWRYLCAHPSRSWTMNRLADALPEWLAGQPEGSEVLVDMALLDRAVHRGFEAADGRVLTPAGLLAGPAYLALAPHVTLLRLTSSVHEVRGALLSRDPPPEVRPGVVHLVVFRRGIRMRHWAIGPAEYTVLAAIGRGAPLAEAIEAPVRQDLIDAPTLAAEIGGWFEGFAERRLVVLAGA